MAIPVGYSGDTDPIIPQLPVVSTPSGMGEILNRHAAPDASPGVQNDSMGLTCHAESRAERLQK